MKDLTYLLIVLWYLIGSVGGLYIAIKIDPVVRVKDLVFCFTIAGIGGIVTILTGLFYIPDMSSWWNKEARIW